MEDDKNKKKAKDIVAKIRYSHLFSLEKSEIIALLKESETEKKLLQIDLSLRDNKISELESKIMDYKNGVYNKRKYSEYKVEWGGIEKVIYILKENNKLMFSNEIESAILELQPKLKLEWKDTRGNTLRYITRAIKDGRVIKYFIGNGFTYALPEWFGEEGNLLKQFSFAK